MKARVGFLLLSALLMTGMILLLQTEEADLTGLAAIRTLEQAREAGCVVEEDGVVTSGQEVWADFYAKTRTGEAAAVWLAGWFSKGVLEGGPALYVRELDFDGRTYTVRGGEREETYQCLLYFPDVPAPSPSSTYETATYYILADDETLTWPEIFRSWVSSSWEGGIRSRAVYTEYVWRDKNS